MLLVRGGGGGGSRDEHRHNPTSATRRGDVIARVRALRLPRASAWSAQLRVVAELRSRETLWVHRAVLGRRLRVAAEGDPALPQVCFVLVLVFSPPPPTDDEDAPRMPPESLRNAANVRLVLVDRTLLHTSATNNRDIYARGTHAEDVENPSYHVTAMRCTFVRVHTRTYVHDSSARFCPRPSKHTQSPKCRKCLSVCPSAAVPVSAVCRPYCYFSFYV